MSDIRKKLEIPKEALESVNKFFLDENNPLINDLLNLLDKYGGIEDINKKLLLGFCRLRIFNGQAGIRELHVYGQAVDIGEKGTIQHRGFGKKLLKEAEKIVKRNKIKKLKITSGVGVKQYYVKFDYKKEGEYMAKFFK